MSDNIRFYQFSSGDFRLKQDSSGFILYQVISGYKRIVLLQSV